MAESGVGALKREGTGRHDSQTPAPARHQRARCAGCLAGQGAAAARGGREGAGTLGHATTDPLRLAGLLLLVPPDDTPYCYYDVIRNKCNHKMCQ